MIKIYIPAGSNAAFSIRAASDIVRRTNAPVELGGYDQARHKRNIPSDLDLEILEKTRLVLRVPDSSDPGPANRGSQKDK